MLSPPNQLSGFGARAGLRQWGRQPPWQHRGRKQGLSASGAEEFQLKENKFRRGERERSPKPLFKCLGKWRGKKLFQLLWKCILFEDGDSSLTLKSLKTNIQRYNTPVSMQGEWVIKLEDECLAVQLTASVKKDSYKLALDPGPLFASTQANVSSKIWPLPLSHFCGTRKCKSKKEKKISKLNANQSFFIIKKK